MKNSPHLSRIARLRYYCSGNLWRGGDIFVSSEGLLQKKFPNSVCCRSVAWVGFAQEIDGMETSLSMGVWTQMLLTYCKIMMDLMDNTCISLIRHSRSSWMLHLHV